MHLKQKKNRQDVARRMEDHLAQLFSEKHWLRDRVGRCQLLGRKNGRKSSGGVEHILVILLILGTTWDDETNYSIIGC